ncbi:hypothetical protein [Magnetospirillum molischianum]|uniref:Uncharacterized protein n=1 Tax=Magnetospirillum molischianum DSM 120 TaxID=1150626 RepID=H8FRM6_MAGML|nr:hypothetical protein [Magnetospirillum molischianum]CCG41014.1 conserved exported hypothetical protein [Magnetospirillum molischianum DSM 120]
MSVLAKVSGLITIGLLLVFLYLSVATSGAIFGAVADPSPGTSPLGFAVYIGLLLTAICGALVMLLATSGGSGKD